MIAPDGQRFGDRITILELMAPSGLVIDHGQDIDDDPDASLMTVAHDELADGGTVLTRRQLHPSAEQRAALLESAA